METIIGLVALYIGWIVIAKIIGTVARTSGRVLKKVITGKDTYFGPAQIKIVDEKLEESEIAVKKIMLRGVIPVPHSMSLGYSISAFDCTDGDDKWGIILSILEQTQETESICFGLTQELGIFDQGSSYTDWINFGAILPDFLQPPKSGSRTIKIIVRVYNAENPPVIHAGYHDGGELLLYKELEFKHTFTEKGYEEVEKHREEAQALSLKIGVAVAIADGNLDDAEGETLRNWIVKEISPFSDEKHQRLKDLFNSALKEGFFQGQSGTLSLSSLVERLSEIGDKKSKYDAIELCFDVMAADGIVDPEEMTIIKKIAESLNLDMDEIEKMREGVTLNLSATLTTEAGLESLVGIEEGWSNDQKRKHIRIEFQKWSNRLNSLAEGDERESAQNMLDNIASLRKKYD